VVVFPTPPFWFAIARIMGSARAIVTRQVPLF
jgi:hypothetical protein